MKPIYTRHLPGLNSNQRAVNYPAMYFQRGFAPGCTARKLSGFWNGAHVDVRRNEIWVEFDDVCMILWPLWNDAAFKLFTTHYRRFNWNKRSDRKKLKRFAKRVVRSWVDPFASERAHDREWLSIIEGALADLNGAESTHIYRQLTGQARLLRAKIADPLAYRSPLYVFEDKEAGDD